MREGDWDIKKIGKDICAVQRYLGSESDVIVPDRIGAYVPVEIGAGFLKKSNKAETVSIPRSVDYIDPAAFQTWRNVRAVKADGRRLKSRDGILYDGSFKSLVFYPPKSDVVDYEAPETLRRVAEGAFSAGTPLRTFAFHDSFDEFSVSPSECPFLESFIALGEGALSVRDAVLFKGRTLLFYPSRRAASEYSIPDGTEAIAPSSEPLFPSSLRTLHVPYSLKSGLEESARAVGGIDVEFGNPRYKSVDGVLFSAKDKKLLAYPEGKEDDIYMVPKGTSAIASHAFYGAKARTVILPSSVVHIEAEAFASSQIESLVIPMTVMDMDIRALYGMDCIRSVYVEPRSVADVYLSGSFLSDKARYIGSV